jgi:hypothetical protein
VQTRKDRYLYILITLLGIVILYNGYRIIQKRYFKEKMDTAVAGQPMTTIEIPASTKDVGKIRKNDLAEATFKIINKGNYPLVIGNVTVDCHCTIVSWSKVPVGPYDSTNIKIRYDTSQPGFFQKKALVYLNADKSPVLLLMRGQVTMD